MANPKSFAFLLHFYRYSSRVNYDVACGMDFHRFPVDEQKCEIKYESFGYTTRQVSWFFLIISTLVSFFII